VEQLACCSTAGTDTTKWQARWPCGERSAPRWRPQVSSRRRRGALGTWGRRRDTILLPSNRLRLGLAVDGILCTAQPGADSHPAVMEPSRQQPDNDAEPPQGQGQAAVAAAASPSATPGQAPSPPPAAANVQRTAGVPVTPAAAAAGAPTARAAATAATVPPPPPSPVPAAPSGPKSGASASLLDGSAGNVCSTS